ncbi:MAG: hypothetical protein IKP68_09325 [Clostridia bacterium]|nr:hypothetical protein [Clostridia bacterium]
MNVTEELKKSFRDDKAAEGKLPDSYIMTGIKGLDDIIAGLAPGYLTLIASRPGMGKTALMIQMTEIILRSGHRVMTFSLETSGERLLSRLDVPAEYTDNLKICDEIPLSVRQIAERYDAAGGADVVFVDYLTLLDGLDGKCLVGAGDAAYSNRCEVLEELKEFCRDKNTHVIIFALLARLANSDRGPTIKDVGVHVVAPSVPDNIILIHRYPYYSDEESVPKEEQGPYGELIVAKNRHGKIGEVKVLTKITASGALRFISLDTEITE